MPETLEKLRPDRDLQCYFFRPSAIAALSETSPNGFKVTGSWRQQFDWAVVEWNRDNVFEHPMFRSLPDGDLSGLTLTYEETRSNCISIDSDLYPTVDWPTLRIWADPQEGSGEHIYFVPLKNYAVPIEGSYTPASAEIELGGTVTPGDYAGLSIMDKQFAHLMTANPLTYALQNLTEAINGSPLLTAAQNGARLTVSYVGTGPGAVKSSVETSTTGANGNRFALYTFGSGSRTEQWDVSSKQLSGGSSPTKWRITLPLASLTDRDGLAVPLQAMRNVRKLRWTYAADLQPGAFKRSEFAVSVSNWQVTGTGRAYSVAGPGSRRIEDDAPEVVYSGAWNASTSYGHNFSGGKIHCTAIHGASFVCAYSSAQAHSLYFGSRLATVGSSAEITVDGGAPVNLNLAFKDEDVLIRSLVGQFPAGDHTVRVRNTGTDGKSLYFDFLEIAIPATSLPANEIESDLTAATDWDTDHSIALAPERTAWMIESLGLKGRPNHYVGALWFYELANTGNRYASVTVTFTGTPDFSALTKIIIGRIGQPLSSNVEISHQNTIGDTTETLAKAFELLINSGYTAIWAQATGNQVTIYSRSMGLDGTNITIGVSPSTANLTTTTSGATTLAGGVEGVWRTDLTATPRINRAARDWTRSFCNALRGYGHDDVTAAFSMELQHGDPSPEAGIAQRYPNGDAVQLLTPALQTNFSSVSIDFWKQVYLDMAQVQTDAGLRPYLQFGEVQWWYNTDGAHSGMPFYDDYTKSTFRAQYGRELAVITTHDADPAATPQESAFLPTLIGAFTNAIMDFVRATFPQARFEVLYPIDVNNTPLNRVINYPTLDWTPSTLTCLKTESFNYTLSRDLDLCLESILAGAARGFPASKLSHLVGVGDASSPWLKEVRLAESYRFDSVVLFALDQMCLIGYPMPLSQGMRRSVQLG